MGLLDQHVDNIIATNPDLGLKYGYCRPKVFDWNNVNVILPQIKDKTLKLRTEDLKTTGLRVVLLILATDIIRTVKHPNGEYLFHEDLLIDYPDGTSISFLPALESIEKSKYAASMLLDDRDVVRKLPLKALRLLIPVLAPYNNRGSMKNQKSSDFKAFLKELSAARKEYRLLNPKTPSTKAPASVKAPKPKKEPKPDPLLKAINGSDPYRFNRFQLHRLSKKRWEAVKDQWFAAPPNIKQAIMHTPKEYWEDRSFELRIAGLMAHLSQFIPKFTYEEFLSMEPLEQLKFIHQFNPKHQEEDFRFPASFIKSLALFFGMHKPELKVSSGYENLLDVYYFIQVSEIIKKPFVSLSYSYFYAPYHELRSSETGKKLQMLSARLSRNEMLPVFQDMMNEGSENAKYIEAHAVTLANFKDVCTSIDLDK